jgi:hypothetical protein
MSNHCRTPAGLHTPFPRSNIFVPSGPHGSVFWASKLVHVDDRGDAGERGESGSSASQSDPPVFRFYRLTRACRIERMHCVQGQSLP